MNKFVKPFVCLVALAIPALASATVQSDVISIQEVKITYDPSEVITNYGFAEVERKIRDAAEKVCGLPGKTSGRNGTIRQMMESRQCYEQAVSTALSEVTEMAAQLNKRVATN